MSTLDFDGGRIRFTDLASGSVSEVWGKLVEYFNPPPPYCGVEFKETDLLLIFSLE